MSRERGGNVQREKEEEGRRSERVRGSSVRSWCSFSYGLKNGGHRLFGVGSSHCKGGGGCLPQQVYVHPNLPSCDVVFLVAVWWIIQPPQIEYFSQ